MTLWRWLWRVIHRRESAEAYLDRQMGGMNWTGYEPGEFVLTSSKGYVGLKKRSAYVGPGK